LAATEKLAGEIDVDHGFPIVERHLRDRRVLLHSGVGHEHVEPAERFDRLLEERRDVVLLRDVARQRDRGTAAGPKLLGEFLRGFPLRVIVDGHRRPDLTEIPCDGLADPGTRPGYEDDDPVEPTHVRFCP
jgi:hypothetical protein